MVSAQSGHRAQIKDTVRDFQIARLERTLPGNDAKRASLAQHIVTGMDNAAMLRTMAEIGTDTTRCLDERLKLIEALVVETLPALRIENQIQPGDIESLMRSLREILCSTDADAVYGALLLQINGLLTTALGSVAAKAQPDKANPLDNLQGSVRQLLTDFRYRGISFDRFCDTLATDTAYECCRLGIAKDALSDFTKVLTRVHKLLVKADALGV